MFINFSNHRSELWSKEQMEAAEKYGKVYDLPFPNIEPDMSNAEVVELAETFFTKIIAMSPSAVMCQGEFTFVYNIVILLKTAGIKVVAACTEREAVERQLCDGTIEKKALFRFVRFREY